jgi:hypothetical protein
VLTDIQKAKKAEYNRQYRLRKKLEKSLTQSCDPQLSEPLAKRVRLNSDTDNEATTSTTQNDICNDKTLKNVM